MAPKSATAPMGLWTELREHVNIDSPLTLLITAICAGVMLLDSFGLGIGKMLFVCWPIGQGFSFVSPLSYLRLFSHVLGHVNWGHLYGNLTLFLLVAPNVEHDYGKQLFGRMIIVTAGITGFVHIFIGRSGLTGLSGIVFMAILLNGFAAMPPRLTPRGVPQSSRSLLKGKLPLTLIVTAFLWISREILNAFGTDHVSQMAHIVGGLCGGLFGIAIQEKMTPLLSRVGMAPK